MQGMAKQAEALPPRKEGNGTGLKNTRSIEKARRENKRPLFP